MVARIKRVVAIANDYTVVVSKRVTDYSVSNGVMQYHGKKIILPEEQAFYPSVKKLEQHRGRFT